MGISRERARQIEEQAIRRIRRAFVRARVLSSAAAPLR
jgi:DNA-directed RNA polymerase sigma subunit (sigma70/sigma32)